MQVFVKKINEKQFEIRVNLKTEEEKKLSKSGEDSITIIANIENQEQLGNVRNVLNIYKEEIECYLEGELVELEHLLRQLHPPFVRMRNRHQPERASHSTAETLGKGSFGEVLNSLNYTVTNEAGNPITKLSKFVLKIQFYDSESTSRTYERWKADLKNEVEITKKIYPSTSDYTIAQQDGQEVHYFWMLRLPKQLKTYLEENTKLSFEERLRIAYAVLQPIKRFLKNGIIHRDLNIRNILLRVENNHVEAFVADFGGAYDVNNLQYKPILGYGTKFYRPPEATHTLATQQSEFFSYSGIFGLIFDSEIRLPDVVKNNIEQEIRGRYKVNLNEEEELEVKQLIDYELKKEFSRRGYDFSALFDNIGPIPPEYGTKSDENSKISRIQKLIQQNGQADPKQRSKSIEDIFNQFSDIDPELFNEACEIGLKQNIQFATSISELRALFLELCRAKYYQFIDHDDKKALKAEIVGLMKARAFKILQDEIRRDLAKSKSFQDESTLANDCDVLVREYHLLGYKDQLIFGKLNRFIEFLDDWKFIKLSKEKLKTKSLISDVLSFLSIINQETLIKEIDQVYSEGIELYKNLGKSFLYDLKEFFKKNIEIQNDKLNLGSTGSEALEGIKNSIISEKNTIQDAFIIMARITACHEEANEKYGQTEFGRVYKQKINEVFKLAKQAKSVKGLIAYEREMNEIIVKINMINVEVQAQDNLPQKSDREETCSAIATKIGLFSTNGKVEEDCDDIYEDQSGMGAEPISIQNEEGRIPYSYFVYF